MGANDAANQRGFQPIGAVFPQGTAVLHIFFQKYIRQTRITQQNGQLKVDAAAGTDLLHQQIVSLAGAPGLADQEDLPLFDGKHRLDVQQPPGQRSGLGDAAAPLEIFQGIYQRQDAYVLPLLRQLPDQGGSISMPRSMQVRAYSASIPVPMAAVPLSTT